MSESISVNEFDAIIAEIFERKAEIEDDKEKLTEKQNKLDQLKAKIVLALKETDRDSFKSPYGTVTISERWRVSLPSEDVDKAALFKHLEERGISMKYLTVNSNSLNSLYMADWEAAKIAGEGMDFKMPGVSEPTLFEDLRITKSKK